MQNCENNKTYDALKLGCQLCFPLYAASRETIRLYKPLLDEIDLTYTQYITMMLLWENKSMNVKEIGARLFLDSGTLTPLLKKLENKGFINRCRMTDDERFLNITVTEKGMELRDKALDIPYKMLDLLPLEEEEIRTVYNLLNKLLEKISGEKEKEKNK